MSLAIYRLAMPVAGWNAFLALAGIAVAALIWIVPDTRFARAAEKA